MLVAILSNFTIHNIDQLNKHYINDCDYMTALTRSTKGPFFILIGDQQITVEYLNKINSITTYNNLYKY